MSAWLKLGYHTEARSDQRYWENVSWVSDSPGRSSGRWKTRPRPQIGTSRPPHGPRYEAGDQLVMYLTGPRRCPAILEVTHAPIWDPDRVDRESGSPGDGDQWGVLTEVVALASLALDRAPAVEEIGVAPRSLAQHGHVHLEEWQLAEAERLISGGSGLGSRLHPRRGDRTVPVEATHVEGYDVRAPKAVARARRREARLVQDFVEYLRAQGDQIERNELTVPGTTRRLYTDVFNVSRRQLIEAKAGTSRNEVRMAIGQLADYRYLLGTQLRAGVLLEAKPEPSLVDLLGSLKIATIWPEGAAFVDSAGGSFT